MAPLEDLWWKRMEDRYGGNHGILEKGLGMFWEKVLPQRNFLSCQRTQ